MDTGKEQNQQKLAFFELLTNYPFRDAVATCEGLESPDERDMRLRKLALDFLPPDHKQRKLNITAVSYDFDFLAQSDEGQQLVTLDGATVQGFVSARLGDKNRVFLDIEHHETGEFLGPEGKTSRYLILPDVDNIFSAQLAGEAAREEEVLGSGERTSELIDTCLSAIQDEDFATMSRAKRMEALQMLVLDIRRLLTPNNQKLKDGLALVCTGAYFVNDNQLLTGVENQFVKKQNPNEDMLVVGTNAKVFYPELDIYPWRPYDRQDDFTIGHGAPCISVRDESDTGSWWVPLACLKDFAPKSGPA